MREVKTGRWTPRERARAVELRAAGLTLACIGEKLKRNASTGATLAKILRGVFGPRKGRRLAPECPASADPAVEARILLYRERAARGEPLFDADVRAGEPPLTPRTRTRGAPARVHAPRPGGPRFGGRYDGQ